MTAIILLGHGGPRSPADVPDFLRAIRKGREPSPEAVAEVARRYRAIGGSPLAAITERLAASLAHKHGIHAAAGWLYGRPSIAQAVAGARSAGHHDALAVCLSAFASVPGSGACLAALREAADDADLRVKVVERIGDRPEYLRGTANALTETLDRLRAGDLPGPAVTIFTTHSLPSSPSAGAELYSRQFADAAACIAALAGLEPTAWAIAFQSAPRGGTGWLGPSAPEVVERSAGTGAGSVVVAPLGFLADQLEVLYDIDIELAAETAARGIHLERVPLLNDGPVLLGMLSALFAERLPHAGPSRPLQES